MDWRALVQEDEFPGTPNEDIYIGHSVAYHNHGTPGVADHSGSGIVLGGVKRGMIEHSEAYESGDQSDASETGGPVGIWAWNSDQVTIQFCKSHDMATANNADGGGSTSTAPRSIPCSSTTCPGTTTGTATSSMTSFGGPIRTTPPDTTSRSATAR